MTEPPKTLAELDALLAKAKESGIQPIMQWNKPPPVSPSRCRT